MRRGVCGKYLTATCKYHHIQSRTTIELIHRVDQGKSVTAEVVDSCPGCGYYDLDFSPAAFEKLAPLSVGRLYGVSWHFD